MKFFEDLSKFWLLIQFLQNQNFSFSKRFYSFSAIFKRMLTSTIQKKIFFSLFLWHIYIQNIYIQNFISFQDIYIYMVLFGYCKHLKSYIILSKSVEVFKDKIRKWKPNCSFYLCKTYINNIGFVETVWKCFAFNSLLWYK